MWMRPHDSSRASVLARSPYHKKKKKGRKKTRELAGLPQVHATRDVRDERESRGGSPAAGPLGGLKETSASFLPDGTVVDVTMISKGAAALSRRLEEEEVARRRRRAFIVLCEMREWGRGPAAAVDPARLMIPWLGFPGDGSLERVDVTCERICCSTRPAVGLVRAGHGGTLHSDVALVASGAPLKGGGIGSRARRLERNCVGLASILSSLGSFQQTGCPQRPSRRQRANAAGSRGRCTHTKAR